MFFEFGIHWVQSAPRKPSCNITYIQYIVSISHVGTPAVYIVTVIKLYAPEN